MSFPLTASVGIGGANRSWDVIFVQDALNNVPTAEGGPAKPLDPDGLCGPLTKGAIQKFQLHHFGWGGADGLVEVEKQTHQKLNEYQKKPPVPPVPPPPKEPKATKFVVFTTHTKKSFGANVRDWFFQIRSVPHNYGARYWLGPHPGLMPLPAPTEYNGHFSIFNTKGGPITTREFECDAVYLTRELPQGLDSELILFLKSGAVTIPMQSHVIGPGGLLSHGNHPTGSSASKAGRFFPVPP